MWDTRDRNCLRKSHICRDQIDKPDRYCSLQNPRRGPSIKPCLRVILFIIFRVRTTSTTWRTSLAAPVWFSILLREQKRVCLKIRRDGITFYRKFVISERKGFVDWFFEKSQYIVVLKKMYSSFSLTVKLLSELLAIKRKGFIRLLAYFERISPGEFFHSMKLFLLATFFYIPMQEYYLI